MRIISEKRIKEFIRNHANAAPSMKNFIQVLRAASWKNIHDVREQLPHADLTRVQSGNAVTIFNVGGGNFRVVTRIVYDYHIVYILAVLTHAEYSKGTWKDRL